MQRIMIIGPGNAGKSTLATALGEVLTIPVYYLDKNFWQANADWQRKDREVFLEEQRVLVSRKKWIIEGDFCRSYSIRASAADTIVILNIPRRIIIPRFFYRVFKYRKRTRPDMAEGNIERVNIGYIKWLWTYDRDKLLQVAEDYGDTKKVYVLNSPKEVKYFLNQVQKTSGN